MCFIATVIAFCISSACTVTVFGVNSLTIQISSDLSIEFFNPTLIGNTTGPDKFVKVDTNFIAGDLGSGTFTETTVANQSMQWNESYVHSSTKPAIGYAFPIDEHTITNFGTFSTIPPNTSVKSMTAANFTHFWKSPQTGVNQLMFNTSTKITTVFQGIPYGISDSKFATGLRMHGSANIQLKDGSFLQTAIVYWGGNPTYKSATSIICFRSTDLVVWNFLSIIANASQYLSSQEGPNEHDLAYLSDQQTLLCLIRMDGGDGPASHPYKYYAKSTSVDQGRTWSKLEYVEHMGCARPRLRLFGSVLLASGGRMRNDNTSDILLWVNGDGMARQATDWTMISLSYVHNQLMMSDPAYLFDAHVNSTTYSPRETNSYTSLVNGQGMQGFVSYDMIKSGQKHSFSVDFVLNLS